MKKIKNTIDCLVFISDEDDKYRVLGGIGTYLGVLSSNVKKIFPEIDVYWVTKSHNKKDFIEVDENGVVRHYLTDTMEYKKMPFKNLINISDDNQLFQTSVFNYKISDTVLNLIKKYKNVVIETGEWEGLGHEIFRLNNEKNILKVVRLHTPLATCMKQNCLEKSDANSFQLLNEYLTIINSDFISACTHFVKNNVIKDVLGVNSKLSKQIEVLPNPINTDHFNPDVISRKASVNLLNKILKKKFVSDDTFNIYTLGSVENRKGVQYIIDSVPDVVDNIPEVRFCFMGHCGDDNEINLNANTKLSLKKLLSRIPKKYHNHVAFTNYVEHDLLPQLISSGDLFPITSLGDNFPGTVAEISLSQKPIIALSRGGVKEMLSNSKGEFLAFNIGSSLQNVAGKLSKGIIFLYNNRSEREKIAKNIRRLIVNNYNPEKVVNQIIKKYNALLKKKSSSS